MCSRNSANLSTKQGRVLFSLNNKWEVMGNDLLVLDWNRYLAQYLEVTIIPITGFAYYITADIVAFNSLALWAAASIP